MAQFKIRATSFYWIDGDADDPEDEFRRSGYLTFWKEWHRRRRGA